MKKLSYVSIKQMEQTINMLEESAIINENITARELIELCQEFSNMVKCEYESQKLQQYNDLDFGKEKYNECKRLPEWR